MSSWYSHRIINLFLTNKNQNWHQTIVQIFKKFSILKNSNWQEIKSEKFRGHLDYEGTKLAHNI
jgi:hypothetical protein